jgi:SWIM zinc finger
MTQATSIVTPEQIDACTRLYDMTRGGEVFYQVQSESDPDKVYEVRFNRHYRRLACTCPAGQEGFYCKHRRWVGEAEKEYRQLKAAAARIEAERDAAETAEQAQIEAYVRQGIDRETATRIVFAKPAPKGNAKPYSPKAFSLLA